MADVVATMTEPPIDWQPFIEGSPTWAHATTQRAVEALGPGAGRQALDVGSGNGRDARFLADAGFDVTAVDICVAAPDLQHPQIQLYCSDIVDFPLARYALVNASLVFPFIPRSRFAELWTALLAALLPGGIIAGHLSATRDWKVDAGHAWACEATELEALLRGLETVSLVENEVDGPNRAHAVVHKHNYEFVARKR